jgi:hypothetical protein
LTLPRFVPSSVQVSANFPHALTMRFAANENRPRWNNPRCPFGRKNTDRRNSRSNRYLSSLTE